MHDRSPDDDHNDDDDDDDDGDDDDATRMSCPPAPLNDAVRWCVSADIGVWCFLLEKMFRSILLF